MKRHLKRLKEGFKEREKQKIINNFYTKEIKKGKTARADIIDKIFLKVILSIILVFFIYKIIGNIFVSMVLGSIFVYIGIKKLKKLSINLRQEKINMIKEEYDNKLREEKIITEGEDIEDYVLNKHYEEKSMLKSNINFFNKSKIIKLYFLAIILYMTSYISVYLIYYRIMAMVSFCIGTFICSYNLTEYIKKIQ